METTDPRVTAARKLVTLAEELRTGKSFRITRLTVLRRLCAEWESAAPFACYLADLSHDHFRTAPPPLLDPNVSKRSGNRIANVVSCIYGYMGAPTRDADLALRAARGKLQSAQSEARDTRWQPYAPSTAVRGWRWRMRSTASSTRETPPRGDTGWAAPTRSGMTRATGLDWCRNPHLSCGRLPGSGSQRPVERPLPSD
jgi:hypothetical protein